MNFSLQLLQLFHNFSLFLQWLKPFNPILIITAVDEGVVHRKHIAMLLLHPTPPAEAPLGCCCCSNLLPHILIGHHHPLILNCLKLFSFLHSSPLVLSNTFIQFLHNLLNFILIACSLTCMVSILLIKVELGKTLASNHCSQ